MAHVKFTHQNCTIHLSVVLTTSAGLAFRKKSNSRMVCTAGSHTSPLFGAHFDGGDDDDAGEDDDDDGDDDDDNYDDDDKSLYGNDDDDGDDIALLLFASAHTALTVPLCQMEKSSFS